MTTAATQPDGRLQELADSIKKLGLEIFACPECPQEVRDAIEWFAAELSVSQLPAAQPTDWWHDCKRLGRSTPVPLGRSCGECGAVAEGATAQADLIEKKAREIYDGWKHMPGWVPWVEGGNSHKQDEARRIATGDGA